MTEGTALLLANHLHELKLGAILRQYPSLVRQARETGQDYEEFLLTLAETEIRTENRLKRRIRDARFPLLKTFEQYRYESAPDLDRRLIEELKTGRYIQERRNVIFTGKTGTGKTHLAIALGIEACRQGIRSRFVTGSELVNELVESRSERILSRSIQRFAKSGLLILDELGYVPFSKEGAQLLFQVMADRYERGSMIVTTNLGFADWTQLFGDPTLTAALLDRLTHNAFIVNCNWESYRLQESLKKKKKTAH
ncbi:MAG: IS21 family transposase ISCth9 [Syntrophus sp. SKADARSKE-3]|nr:IS21 family transposase ISCth9 [Syntrophus sp. SKADARSKE-3]